MKRNRSFGWSRWAVSCLGAGWLLFAVPASLAADAPGAGLRLPFTEEFGAGEPGWTKHASEGSWIRFEGGRLEVRARSAGQARLERPFGVDLARVSAEFSSDGAPVAFFLKWDEANFIQVGVNYPLPGRLCVREVLGTYARDYDLGPAPEDKAAQIALELAADCLRYEVSWDGKEFRRARLGARPERFAGPPRWLVLGQECAGKLFHPPSPWVPRPAAKALGEGRLGGLRVMELSAERRAASAAERGELARAGRDLFGEAELARAEDPSFDSVCRYYPALRWPREVIGVKDHPQKIGVAVDGTLQFTARIAVPDQPSGYFVIDGHRFGSFACAKKLYRGWQPVVVATERQGELEYEQTVFGYSARFSPEEPLAAYVQLRILNLGEIERTATVAFKAAPGQTNLLAPWRLTLPSRASAVIHLRAPYAVLEQTTVEVTEREFAGKLEETAGYWERLVTPGSRFEIPEARVQDAYRAWIAYNFLNVAKRGEVFHVCDGAGFYDRVYGYSAALYNNALDLLGYPELATTYGDSLLTFMQTNGLLAINFGDTDTGAALWSMSEHYWLTRDAAWLRRAAPQMLKMCGWIMDQRQAALARTNEPALTRGLIRYRPYADLLHPAADYFSNGYLCRGLGAAAAVFEEIGMSTEAARLRSESEAYARDIARSMDAAVFHDGGMDLLPAIPDTRELWKESNGSANGYYGIIVPCALEAGIPAWDDPKAQLYVNALEQRGGLTVGVCQFHNLVDHAYTYGYWMNRLQHDQVKPAILGLYASMAYGMSRETYAAVECTAIRSGENYWTLPHTYSNTQQLRLLRNLLVREDGRRLWLAQAAPQLWLAPGKRLAVHDAPTRFGPVSYSLDAAADGSIRVRLAPPGREAPEEIWLRLRRPGQPRLAGMTPADGARVRVEGDVLRISQTRGPLELRVEF